jgi:hypothetical protein
MLKEEWLERPREEFIYVVDSFVSHKESRHDVVFAVVIDLLYNARRYAYRSISKPGPRTSHKLLF